LKGFKRGEWPTEGTEITGGFRAWGALWGFKFMGRKPKTETSTATIGFEAKLWLTADKLRNNMDAAEYKHVVLGLIFLKYISDTFEEHRAKLLAGECDYAGGQCGRPG
jgi:hypothetical protein